MSKLLIIIGVVLVAVGLILQFAPGLLHWFGRLPGDIRIENEHGGFYFPIVSILIISASLSIILHFVGCQ
jgi:tellurite resistance protein TehA-like permease